MIAMLVLMMQTEVFAAGTVTVTADKTNVAIGETIVVSITTSAPEDPSTVPEVAVTYNPDLLNFAGCDVEFGGGGGLVTFKGESAHLTFTTSQTGVATVGVEAIIDDDGANPAAGNAMITIGANAAEGLSDDATLYVLEMNPGQLVPEFSSNVTEYQIVVGNDVTDITVSGAVSDPGANITTASGFKNLKEGTNQAVITVTAASGTMLTYHFTIVRGETEATEEVDSDTETEAEEPVSEPSAGGLDVTIDGMQYTVQSVIPEEAVPAGYVKTTSTFNGKPVEAVLFEKGGLTLLYAVAAGNDSGEFFVYNEASGKLRVFVQIYNVENRYIVPIEAQDNAPGQFKAADMHWNDFMIPAFTLADTSIANAQDFYLLYAVSNEGERGFYLYDSMEGTYQRFLNYTGAKAAAVAPTEGGFGKQAVLVIAVLVILLLGAFILIINMIVKNKEMQEDSLYEKKAAQKKKPSKAVKQQPKLEPKPVVKKPEPKPAMKKTVVPELPEEPEMEEEFEEVAEVAVKPVKKQEVKPVEKPVQKAAEQEKPVQTPQPSRPVMHTDHVVTLKPRQVEGAVGITGNIPVKVVPTPKTEVRRPSVPIFTLEKPGGDLDDDFEFEFINIDND